MADIQHYERVLKTEKAAMGMLPKLLMIAGYVLIFSIWLVITIRVGLSAALLMLIPLSILTAVILTWKYTSVEHEYSFTAGILSYAKIYGKSRRTLVFEADLKSLITALPYSDENLESLDTGKVCDAVPAGYEAKALICVFEENGVRSTIVIDCDEMTVKILRFFKPSAVSSEVWLGKK